MQKEKEKILQASQVGIALCDLEDGVNKEDLPAYIEWWKNRLAQITTPILEIQQESPRYEKNNWKWFPEIPRTIKYLGIHQPIMGRDVISPDQALRDYSFWESVLAMDFANQIRANYYVFHMNSTNQTEKREEQIDRSVEFIKKIVRHRHQQHHYYDLLLETPLEYPKFPSGMEETVDIVERIKDFFPNIGLTVDVAHFWHNVVDINPGVHEINHNNNYPELFREFLSTLEKRFPGAIKIFHLGGAYITEDHQDIQTHALPGMYYGQHWEGAEHAFLSSPPDEFQGKWMPIRETVGILSDFAVSSRRSLNIILEINNTPLAERLGASLTIRNEITAPK